MTRAADELREVLRAQKARPPAASIEEFRQRIEALTAPYSTLPAGVEARPAQGVPGRWFESVGKPSGRVVLWLHGGTYVGGSSQSHAGLAARLAKAADARVLLLDYRRAPEHPFPAAVDDAVAAYRWLLVQGHAASDIVVGGDSAGSALAIAVALAERQASRPQPAGLHLLSPWSDLAFTGASFACLEGQDPWMSGPRLRRSAGLYLGSADPRDPRASPLYADLHGLAPMLIQVGSDEVLLDDAVRLADRATAAGVSVEVEVAPDMWHVWPLFAARLPEGQAAIDRAAAWMRSLAADRRKA